VDVTDGTHCYVVDNYRVNSTAKHVARIMLQRSIEFHLQARR
jgi:hypothetical protein